MSIVIVHISTESIWLPIANSSHIVLTVYRPACINNIGLLVLAVSYSKQGRQLLDETCNIIIDQRFFLCEYFLHFFLYEINCLKGKRKVINFILN